MTRKERVRRVAILCCNFARYLAHYRAGWAGGKAIFKGRLWTSVNNACLDQCVLEWCKLFADDEAKHHWRRTVDKPKQFESQLLAELKMTREEFTAFSHAMRRYRDKSAAQLDSEKAMSIPDLAPADASVLLLYRRIRDRYKGHQVLDGLPPDISDYYRVSAADAEGALYGSDL